MSHHLSKSLKDTLHLKWIAPYLTIPILFVASIYLNNWLQEAGILPYFPLKQRTVLLIWRIVIIAAFVTAPLGTIFLSKVWKPGFFNLNKFLFSLLALFLLATLAASLSAYGILLPLKVPFVMISSMLLTRCLFVILWSVSVAALCSSINNGPGGAVLSIGIFSIASLPGLTDISVTWWAVAPIGDLVLNVEVISSPWSATLAVLAHTLVYLSAAYFILKQNLR